MAKKDTGMMTGEPVTYQIPAPAGGVQMETFIPWTLVKRGVRRQVITPIDAPEQFQREAVVERSARKQAKDSPLIRALGLAHYWQRLLDDGKYWSLTEIAAVEGIDRGQANRISLLTKLAPAIIQSCLSDHHAGTKMEPLAKACHAVIWSDQTPILAMGKEGRQSAWFLTVERALATGKSRHKAEVAICDPCPPYRSLAAQTPKLAIRSTAAVWAKYARSLESPRTNILGRLWSALTITHWPEHNPTTRGVAVV